GIRDDLVTGVQTCALPIYTLDPVRKPDPSGRITVSLALPRPGSATWLDLDGERIAVVASAAQRAIGNPKSRRFVDFEILPSRHRSEERRVGKERRRRCGRA